MRVQAGSAKGTKLKGAPSSRTRPSSDAMRETLFNVLQAQVAGSKFLDLFAGTGSVGIEALSRGAESCTFVERNAGCIKTIRHNLVLSKLEDKARVIREDALRFLSGIQRRVAEPFDIVFVDPPYAYPHLHNVAAMLLEQAVAVHEGTIVVVQHHRSAELSTCWPADQVKRFGDTSLSFYWNLARFKAKGCVAT